MVRNHRIDKPQLVVGISRDREMATLHELLTQVDALIAQLRR